jgi:hypothetical protein
MFVHFVLMSGVQTKLYSGEHKYTDEERSQSEQDAPTALTTYLHSTQPSSKAVYFQATFMTTALFARRGF